MPPPRLSPSHRPRKKRSTTSSPTGLNHLVIETGKAKQSPAFPLVSFLWPARSGVSQWLILPSILMIIGLFRWAVSLWGYSGFQTPPMYGDYEAQRHWMELTVHLPMFKWYLHDLQYWGLDYPPLTAYHSWLCGTIGSAFNPAWFALDESHGFEDPQLKVFMRATVVVSEYLVYIPAIVNFLRRYAFMKRVHTWQASVALVAVLMQPATILIDHGHFQYNTVMLGLVASSLDAILAGRMLWACIFFVGSLGFKQMALYYAPAMFSFLLGVCIFPRIRIFRLLCISLITLTAFIILLAPFVVSATSAEARRIFWSAPQPPLMQALPFEIGEDSALYGPLFQMMQIIHRVFPFARGIFEDKVANAWCAVNTFYKLHRYEASILQRVALGTTLASIITPCAIIFRRPRASLLLLALASVSWGFFLFSFQVHEKSILLPLLPMTLLLGGEGGLSKETRAWVGWANILGSWTLFPLLRREDLRVPYFVITLLWAYLLGLPPMSLDIYRGWTLNKSSGSWQPHIFSTAVHLCFYAAMIAWHIVEAFVPPPTGKPDLWVVANVLIGAAGAGIAYLWCLQKLIVQCREIDRKVAEEWNRKRL